jgi:hypothetical protein
MAKCVENWTVYALRDPATGKVRYIGWTSKSLGSRLACHIHEASTEIGVHTHKVRWIRTLISCGARPLIEALESGTGDTWSEAERKWIASFRAQGVDLTNGSDGGEGNLGYNASAETRAKLSIANKGRKLNLTPEQRAKRSAFSKAINTGRKMPREAVERRAAKQRGKPRPPEVIEKWHAAIKGRKLSQQEREVIRTRQTGKTATAETRKKMSDSHKGKVPNWTDEGRTRMIAASKNRSLSPEQRRRISEGQRNRPVDMERMRKMRIGHRKYYEALRKQNSEAA